MSRIVTVGGAQLGPTQLADKKSQTIDRMMELLKSAQARNCQFVVFPELALTTFFPRWCYNSWDEVDVFFETAMPNDTVKPLFDFARENSISFYLGYAEKVVIDGQVRRFNTSILVDQQGVIVGKYRKIHLPGHAEYDPNRTFQHLEKRYFEVGNLGFPVWRNLGGTFGMCICNDRRWPETFRVMGLQGVELVALGYNTPTSNSQSDESAELRKYHNRLSMQAAAYQNSCWVVGVAKAGYEDGHELMGESAIVAPTGEVMVTSRTLGDELISYDCDLDDCNFGKQTVFNFAAHRRVEHYQLITE